MNKKVQISIDKCQAGMKVAGTVFNSYGAVVVSQDSILDEHMLAKLRIMGIDKIKIYHMEDREIEQAESEFKEQYTEQVETVRDVIKDISAGKNLDIKKVDRMVDSLTKTGSENRDIIYCINQVRDADEYTYTHSVNVSLLSMMIGKWLKLDSNKVNDLAYAGLLHDIGKAKIDPAILNKPDKLTPEEYEEVKKHVVYGYRILQTLPEISKEISMGVLMHHEREDGSGYTLGAKSEQIHEYAKIIAVADVYDAMTSNRVYRSKVSPFEVFELLQTGTFGQLDASVSITFLNCIANYYIGDICRLSTGEIGEITYINPFNISRPLVRVDNVYVDLCKELSIKIEEIL